MRCVSEISTVCVSAVVSLVCTRTNQMKTCCVFAKVDCMKITGVRVWKVRKVDGIF